MPRLKGQPLPSALPKLIKRYALCERNVGMGILCEKVGISHATISRKQKNPERYDLSDIAKIGKALRIPKEELLEAIWDAVRY